MRNGESMSSHNRSILAISSSAEAVGSSAVINVGSILVTLSSVGLIMPYAVALARFVFTSRQGLLDI